MKRKIKGILLTLKSYSQQKITDHTGDNNSLGEKINEEEWVNVLGEYSSCILNVTENSGADDKS